MKNPGNKIKNTKNKREKAGTRVSTKAAIVPKNNNMTKSSIGKPVLGLNGFSSFMIDLF